MHVYFHVHLIYPTPRGSEYRKLIMSGSISFLHEGVLRIPPQTEDPLGGKGPPCPPVAIHLTSLLLLAFHRFHKRFYYRWLFVVVKLIGLILTCFKGGFVDGSFLRCL